MRIVISAHFADIRNGKLQLVLSFQKPFRVFDPKLCEIFARRDPAHRNESAADMILVVSGRLQKRRHGKLRIVIVECEQTTYLLYDGILLQGNAFLIEQLYNEIEHQ